MDDAGDLSPPPAEFTPPRGVAVEVGPKGEVLAERHAALQDKPEANPHQHQILELADEVGGEAERGLAKMREVEVVDVLVELCSVQCHRALLRPVRLHDLHCLGALQDALRHVVGGPLGCLVEEGVLGEVEVGPSCEGDEYGGFEEDADD